MGMILVLDLFKAFDFSQQPLRLQIGEVIDEFLALLRQQHRVAIINV
jgi:hypothetical protein